MGLGAVLGLKNSV